MDRLVAVLILTVAFACGGDEPVPVAPSVDMPGVEEPSESPTNRSACSVLQPLVDERFGVEPELLTVRSNELSGNDLCRVFWEIPGIDTAEQVRRATDKDLRYQNEVSLTIMGTSYDSAAAAVASLEGTVSSLSAGVSVNTPSGPRTVQSEFGDWLEGVGDRAIAKGSSVLVAADGRRFTVAVTVTDAREENLEVAIELARRIVDEL